MSSNTHSFPLTIFHPSLSQCLSDLIWSRAGEKRKREKEKERERVLRELRFLPAESAHTTSLCFTGLFFPRFFIPLHHEKTHSSQEEKRGHKPMGRTEKDRERDGEQTVHIIGICKENSGGGRRYCLIEPRNSNADGYDHQIFSNTEEQRGPYS